jgi:hypothetical protein
MYPDIRRELARQRQAELIAAGEASRLAAQASTDNRRARRWFGGLTQTRIFGLRERREQVPAVAGE